MRGILKGMIYLVCDLIWLRFDLICDLENVRAGCGHISQVNTYPCWLAWSQDLCEVVVSALGAGTTKGLERECVEKAVSMPIGDRLCAVSH